MAGIGIELRKIFKEESLSSLVSGVLYSTIVIIGPTIIVIGAMVIMYSLLHYLEIPIIDRELLSSTILYVFVFSLITTSPFNCVLSRYIADKIYQEKMEDIMSSYYIGLVLNILFSAILGIPFSIRLIWVGGVNIIYVFASYSLYMALILVFFTMTYLSATKDYKIIALDFFTGMTIGIGIGYVFRYFLKISVIESILYALLLGFIIIAFLEYAYLRKYFNTDSQNYKEVLKYFKDYKKLFLASLFYSVGLYVHNFVLWCRPGHLVVAKSFYSYMSYDMATYLALITNISLMVIFIVRVETEFAGRYKKYSEAVIGATLRLIETTKHTMFRCIIEQINYIAQIQAFITIVIFLIVKIFVPLFGLAGLTLIIYPSVAAAYYVIFIMYANIIFLYYINDENGALITTTVFMVVTLIASIIVTHFSIVELYGLGAFLGGVVGWLVGYLRLRKMERTYDIHTFCQGKLIAEHTEKMPMDLVYNIYEDKDKQSQDEKYKVKKYFKNKSKK